MADLNLWLSDNTDAPKAPDRAVLAWRRIQDKPSSIVIKRGSTTLPAQTVRVEYSEAERDVRGEANSKGATRDVILFGIKDHPTLPTTDLRAGDLFAHDGMTYKVVMVINTLGEVQANAEAYR